jgi:NAD(P)-dependent dehydrogenase (short-subunit alcohol dehydrogenase family)
VQKGRSEDGPVTEQAEERLGLEELFGLDGRVAVVTGGSGAIGRTFVRALVDAGANVAVVGRRLDACEVVCAVCDPGGSRVLAIAADVLERAQLMNARDAVLERWGRVDILVNAAGGNVASATLKEGQSFFDLDPDGFRQVLDLNLLGTVLPAQVFGAAMVREGRGDGSIVTISSMAAQRALTRVAGYSAAKGAIDSFTRWLAVDLALSYGSGIRVNAIAPGFFLGEQNRTLLIEPDGSLTERGQKIVDHTPAGRFGDTSELVSTLLWLCGAGSRFVNGVVVPVDGGFSAFSGV